MSHLVVDFVINFLRTHSDGEAYIYFRNTEGALDEIVATDKTFLLSLGEQYVMVKGEKDGDGTPRIKNMVDLYEVDFGTGDDTSAPEPATSPMPALPGAPAQVE